MAPHCPVDRTYADNAWMIILEMRVSSSSVVQVNGISRATVLNDFYSSSKMLGASTTFPTDA